MAANDIPGMGGRNSLLYPLLLIAAVAVIVFSAVGIATVMGWMPAALSRGQNVVIPGAVEQQGLAPAATVAAPAPAMAPAPAPAPATCERCGVIESIRAVEVKGDSSWMGAGGGAAVGALVGNQLGSGSGRMLASGLGAGAGAYGGMQLEQHLKRRTKYQIRVRMDDGRLRTFLRSRQPDFSVGQKVQVTERGLVAAG
jgi:outer membrane lipoprotein SlyB